MFQLFRRQLYVVDLSNVDSRESFQAAFAKHFPIAEDHADLWSSLRDALTPYPRSYRLRLKGWTKFEMRMPSYARRLRRMLRSFHQLWGNSHPKIDCT